MENKHLLQPAKFHAPIKMHKAPICGRPIINNINSITYFVSRYLSIMLTPLKKKLITACDSIDDVIYDIHTMELLPTEAVFVCADVRNLYPSIPTKYGLDQIKTTMTMFNMYDEDTKNLLLDLLHWVLTNNYFEFMNTTFLQIDGTAMGTPVAVVYANIVLYHHDIECMKLQPIYYKRYIDDLFIIAINMHNGNNILKIFNKQHPAIQLDQETATVGKEGVFMDLKAIINEKKITCILYQKPINAYLYIPPTSNHKQYLLTNFINNEIRRYRLHCSNDEDFQNILHQFYSRLRSRGYSANQLATLFQASRLPDRAVLLDKLKKRKLPSNEEVHSQQNKKKKPIITLQLPPETWKANKFSKIFVIPEAIKEHSNYKKAYEDQSLIVGCSYPPSLGKLIAYKKL
jgi:hypothetical protein